MRYPKYSLTPYLKRKIKRKEKYLNRKCRLMWKFTNPLGTQYLFGNFCKNRNKIIVTIAYFDKNIYKWI